MADTNPLKALEVAYLPGGRYLVTKETTEGTKASIVDVTAWVPNVRMAQDGVDSVEKGEALRAVATLVAHRPGGYEETVQALVETHTGDPVNDLLEEGEDTSETSSEATETASEDTVESVDENPDLTAEHTAEVVKWLDAQGYPTNKASFTNTGRRIKLDEEWDEFTPAEEDASGRLSGDDGPVEIEWGQTDSGDYYPEEKYIPKEAVLRITEGEM